MSKLAFFLILSLFFPFFGESAQFHAIILLDPEARQIECVVEANQLKLETLVEKISLHTQLTLNKYIIKPEEFEIPDFYNFIDNLMIETDDLVLFYFSGHGFRTLSKEGNPWPNLYLTKNHIGLDFNEIVEVISEKHPRFLLALADCCNNVIPEKFAPPLQQRAMALMRLNPQNHYEQKYRELFLNFQGRILISSAFQGEYSWGTKNGGLYTLGFLDSLEEGITKDSSWEEILEKSSLRVLEHQNPYYTSQIESVGKYSSSSAASNISVINP